MEIKLKPCPVCGGTNLQTITSITIDEKRHSVYCLECEHRGPISLRSNREAEIAWNAVADTVLPADDAPERTRWVPVEEHTPKNRYLLCVNDDVMYVAMLSSIDGTWRSTNWGLCRHPTHWMLLPKPPEVKP